MPEEPAPAAPTGPPPADSGTLASQGAAAEVGGGRPEPPVPPWLAD